MLLLYDYLNGYLNWRRNWRLSGGRSDTGFRGSLGGSVARLAVLLPDAFHILLRFGIWRNLLEPVDCGRSRVVGGQRQPVVLIEILEILQILDPGLDVFRRVEAVVHA